MSFRTCLQLLNLRALIAGTCAGLFVFLHVSFYAGSFSAPSSASWEPQSESVRTVMDWMDELLITPVNPPYETQTLEFCEVQTAPSYFLPLRRVRFAYAEQTPGPDAQWNTEDDTMGECDLIERSSFTGFPFLDVHFSPEGWTPKDYWQGFDQEGFMRPLASPSVPSVFFFIVQTSLLGGLVWSVMGKRAQKK